MRKIIYKLYFLILFALIGVICEANEDIDYFPLKIGNSWGYIVCKNGKIPTKVEESSMEYVDTVIKIEKQDDVLVATLNRSYYIYGHHTVSDRLFITFDIDKKGVTADVFRKHLELLATAQRSDRIDTINWILFDQILRHDWIFFGEWILSQSMLNFEIISMNNEVKIGEITLANCLAIKTQPCIIYEKEEWCIIYYYAPNIGRVKIIGRNKNGDEVPLIILTDYNIK